MANSNQRHSLIFKRGAMPPGMIPEHTGFPMERVEEIRMELTSDEYDQLGMSTPITHHMYAEGKSYEEFPTTITARDVVHQVPQARSLHVAIIEGFHQQTGQPKPSPQELFESAIKIDDISPGAVAFMLEMHEQWMDPLEDPDISEILDLAEQHQLTLQDFYRT